jgi:hypothetical protein
MFPPEYRIDGARIELNPAWSGRAPFGAKALFRSGEELQQSDYLVIARQMHPMVMDWIEMTVERIIK